MTTQQPDALRLADQLTANYSNIYTGLAPSCANELRRLHARVQELESKLVAHKIEHTMVHTNIEQQIAAAWNAQADEFNQWDELDLGEKIEWAAKWGASQARKPLSDGRLVEVIEAFTGFISGDVDKFVAHIESAHGITQEKQGDQENG